MKLKRDALKFKYDRYALPAFDFFHFFSANASESRIFLRICVSYGASQRWASNDEKIIYYHQL